ncbi:hypothetical protein BBJ28_00017489 [Nothophytophthora sp. Chile5]|nr:hypothetical protein BBJ28_00017489 [Nothophytophthora sp. Chile5]
MAWIGNVFEAEEILERGVDNGVLATAEKEDLYRRIIVGKAGNATPFSEPPHVEPLQTPRGALKQLDVTTPRGQNSNRSSATLDTTPITTPVGFARSGTSTSGFSTVSKFPRTDNKASVLATPSLPARPTLKSQSTSRKTQHTASRFRTLGAYRCIVACFCGVALKIACICAIAATSGGPPLRVMASTGLNDDKDSDDDDDDMMLVSPKEEHKPLSPVKVNGLRYIKLEQIGSGGSSKVYRMLGPDLKIYALKKIKLKRLDEQSIAQYTNEIELLRRLQGNQHIIKLVAAEQDLQQRQINVVSGNEIMEHGEIDLSERLRDLKDGLDENFLRVIWTQMLQAVDAIHSERIIHGKESDLKPANFLFVNGALKLIDFGIAKAISNDTTNIERDSQVGTVNFMSPEAIQGNAAPNGQRNPQGKMKVGRASDIWSLGCILYQIVYSKPPFADVRSIIEKFRCIIDPSVPIPFPALKNKDLEDVIRSCLQRDHRARPSIKGEHGLLNHPFLRSGGVNAIVSPATTVTMANAPQVLSQLGELLRSQGVESSRVQSFLSIGQEGLRASNGIPRTRGYLYNTEERRTDI